MDNIEKLLGIKKGEKFNIKGSEYGPYEYTGTAIRDNDDDNALYYDVDLISLINHPERVEKNPRKSKNPSQAVEDN